MKRLLLILSIFLTSYLNGSTQVVIHSSNGYDVHIALTLTSVDAPASCPNGYGMKINIAYDISFTGSNIPSNLWTLQGTIDCDHANFISFDLPNNGGMGVNQSSNSYVGNSTCAAATPVSLGCDMINLIIQGPGISYTTNTYTTEELAAGTLPIELRSFSAEVTTNGLVRLDWETASEINNDYFTVQRSQDGQVWNDLDRVPGAGNSSEMIQYSFSDKYPLPSQSFYRLQQTDFDGTETYSSIRSITINQADNDDLLLFPNPAYDVIQIVGSKIQMDKSLSIFNVLGKEVTSLVGFTKLNPTKSELEIRKLERGFYFVQSGENIKKFYKE